MASSVASIPPPREIPTTFSQSLRSWWHTNDKTSAGGGGPSRVALSKPRHFLNTFSVQSTTPSPDAPSPVILLPGYGAGIGFFLKNMPTLSHWAGKRGGSLYAVDWLGMGLSARPPFRIKSTRADISGRVAEAEGWFIDSLEEWRVKQKIERFTLVGHSLGGYLSVAYALRYPDRVDRLILLSPAGIPRDPNETTAPERELEGAGKGNVGRSASSVELASHAKVEEVRKEQVSRRPPESRRVRLFKYLWEEGWSPFQVVRNTLFWAPMLVGKYSSRRFSGLTDEETRAMHDYILHITLSKGSGEYCISHLLAPGAHARRPMVDRIAALKMPITFVYGDHDWMDPQGGEDSVENLRKAGNGNARSYIVSDAGHHVYLDNPKAVNSLLVKELDRKRA
ncbi:AB hydrolase-1 domain-containing protein [Mycena chlorophos]|uniref:AB hydrolase-1 domain-containing protein n=1 Tax=Mycena chlorophos TaxID=658473 RepID=A0A8H6TBC1_MYCCL|nr:AB hydrolase-1 domain-containing protein [Mycena chlorophos]